jgi:hypothetical protein
MRTFIRLKRVVLIVIAQYRVKCQEEIFTLATLHRGDPDAAPSSAKKLIRNFQVPSFTKIVPFLKTISGVLIVICIVATLLI